MGDDEAATDEEYRAFQLARYTGEANMIIKQHEMEFMRKRRRERELGETHGEVQQPEEPQQPVQQPVQYHYTPPQQQNRMSEIMEPTWSRRRRLSCRLVRVTKSPPFLSTQCTSLNLVI